jgi:hypothetical protein
VAAGAGKLTVEYPDGKMQFELGPAAEAWASRILNPRSRLDKLGIRAADSIVVIGIKDPDFEAELAAASVTVSSRATRGSRTILLGAESVADLDRLPALRAKLAPEGGLWVVHRKGPTGVKDVEIFSAGKKAGLTANKVARFSETHTAERLVIPRALR